MDKPCRCLFILSLPYYSGVYSHMIIIDVRRWKMIKFRWPTLAGLGCSGPGDTEQCTNVYGTQEVHMRIGVSRVFCVYYNLATDCVTCHLNHWTTVSALVALILV